MSAKIKNKIQFLTMKDCHSCATVKKTFGEIMPEFSNVKVQEIDIVSTEGQELVQKYSIMTSPGIIINGELFSTGGIDKEKLVKKLESLA